MTKFYTRLWIFSTVFVLFSVATLPAQVTFNIREAQGTQTYVVAMKTTQNWGFPLNQIGSNVQIVVKVPHGEGADLFGVQTITGIVRDPLTGTTITWLQDSVQQPIEAPDFDYIFFSSNGATALPFDSDGDGEDSLFSFTYVGNCISDASMGLVVSIIDNDTDPFSPVFLGKNNSRNRNATNSIDPLGAGGANAFSGTYLDGNRDCSVNFPVELLEFTATPNGSVVDLEWATASEYNNKFFSVERSVDGRLFQELVRVSGQGTTSQLTSYQEIDSNPVPGYSYYRLRQVDLDGTFTRSDVVEVFFDPEAVELGLQVYPNPTSYERGFTLQYDSQEAQKLAFEMYNSNGQLVFQQLVDADRGRNELQIKTGVLSPGVYHLRLFNDSQSESSQVVIK